MDMVVISGNSNPDLTRKMCSFLDLKVADAIVGQFSDGETRVNIKDNVRGKDVFIIQSTCNPANQHIMEAAILADACRRGSAQRITLVAPYFGYGRQERKDAPRTPITAKLVADIIETAGFDRVLTMELHTGAIQGFFNIPVDHLYSKPVFAPYLNEIGVDNPKENIVVVSPDAGGVERARAIAKLFECSLAICDKRRDRPNESAVFNIIGEVAEKHCLMVDDIVDTAGSLTKASGALIGAGAASVSAVVTHGVLSGKAIDNIEASSLKELLITDSIPLSPRAKQCSKIRVASVSELLARAIRRIHKSDSISSLFI